MPSGYHSKEEHQRVERWVIPDVKGTVAGRNASPTDSRVEVGLSISSIHIAIESSTVITSGCVTDGSSIVVDGWSTDRGGIRVTGFRVDLVSVGGGMNHRQAVPTRGIAVQDFSERDYFRVPVALNGRMVHRIKNQSIFR